MKRYLTPLLFGLGVLVVIVLVVAALRSPDKSASTPNTNTAQLSGKELADIQTGHSQGPAEAKTVVVEFGDYQCPACGAAYPPLKTDILPQFAGKIRFVFKNFPLKQLHKNAYISAQAAEAAAAQGKFWEMHDLLYEKQAEWVDLADPVTKFGDYATSIGINANQLTSQVRAGKYAKTVDSDLALATKLNLDGTPTFYVNGKQIDISSGGMNALRDAISQATTQ